MRVAIYARYSSENQSEKSIDDQIRVCQKYIESEGFTVDRDHIYIDEAISGSVINRPGLHALEQAIENKQIDAVAVDDLSRLSRSNHQMLTLVLKFDFHQVKLISVSDGIITNNENAKLDIHMRGLINELYLDDLKKKTMRGLEGQKLRGFSTGESVYGYKSVPVGELKFNKKGQPKYDGMLHKINQEEADIVKRIFREFIDGRSICKIVRGLNIEKILTKKGRSGGWNISTVSRILKCEKYTGLWAWRLWKNVRDPMTGKIKKVPRPQQEQLSSFKENLIIIDKTTWEKAKERWTSLESAFPIKKTANNNLKQKSYVHSNPTHLLAGLLKCHCCDGAIVLISGKGSGYYGCYNARRKTCSNHLTISRNKIESVIISDLKEKILTMENLDYIYKNLEKLIAQGLNDIPDLIKTKKTQHEKILSEIQNYLSFIKAGNFSHAVSDALKEAESREEKLKQDLDSLAYQKENTFVAPPHEWIHHRLDQLHKTLSEKTTASALALKRILGPIRLEPVTDKNTDVRTLIEGNVEGFKPYYLAYTNIRTLALLDDRAKGSNWYKERRR